MRHSMTQQRRFTKEFEEAVRLAQTSGRKRHPPVHRLCRVLGVSQSGYFAWKGLSACRRQCDDMVLLAHVRSALALSNSTYGSPRIRLHRDLALAALRKALTMRRPPAGLIHHSDRGS